MVSVSLVVVVVSLIWEGNCLGIVTVVVAVAVAVVVVVVLLRLLVDDRRQYLFQSVMLSLREANRRFSNMTL